MIYEVTTPKESRYFWTSVGAIEHKSSLHTEDLMSARTTLGFIDWKDHEYSPLPSAVRDR